ncbi:MAG: DUF4416 family protein [Sphaerochaeta sp.]
MGELHSFTQTRLVMGVLSTDETLHEELFASLEQRFGPILEISEKVPFSYTHYYDHEMDGSPVRFFLVFEKLVDPQTLSDIKLNTNQLEDQFRGVHGGRRINLDPGMLSAANFILATTKNRAQRIPLEKGIYAELTLMYFDHEFQILPWTYADYKSDEFRSLFKRYRNDYIKFLKSRIDT